MEELLNGIFPYDADINLMCMSAYTNMILEKPPMITSEAPRFPSTLVKPVAPSEIPPRTEVHASIFSVKPAVPAAVPAAVPPADSEAVRPLNVDSSSFYACPNQDCTLYAVPPLYLPEERLCGTCGFRLLCYCAVCKCWVKGRSLHKQYLKHQRNERDHLVHNVALDIGKIPPSTILPPKKSTRKHRKRPNARASVTYNASKMANISYAGCANTDCKAFRVRIESDTDLALCDLCSKQVEYHCKLCHCWIKDKCRHFTTQKHQWRLDAMDSVEKPHINLYVIYTCLDVKCSMYTVEQSKGCKWTCVACERKLTTYCTLCSVGMEYHISRHLRSKGHKKNLASEPAATATGAKK